MYVTEELQVPADVTPRVTCDRRTDVGTAELNEVS